MTETDYDETAQEAYRAASRKVARAQIDVELANVVLCKAELACRRIEGEDNPAAYKAMVEAERQLTERARACASSAG